MSDTDSLTPVVEQAAPTQHDFIENPTIEQNLCSLPQSQPQTLPHSVESHPTLPTPHPNTMYMPYSMPNPHMNPFSVGAHSPMMTTVPITTMPAPTTIPAQQTTTAVPNGTAASTPGSFPPPPA
ncbi:hypothetical protein BKA69DRAFT_1108407, partial [Paraphysoderma sedebokerense]